MGEPQRDASFHVPHDVWRQRAADQHGEEVRVQPGLRGVWRVELLRADGVQVQPLSRAGEAAGCGVVDGWKSAETVFGACLKGGHTSRWSLPCQQCAIQSACSPDPMRPQITVLSVAGRMRKK